MLDDLGKWFNKWARAKNTHKGLAGYAVVIVIMWLIFTYWAGNTSAYTELAGGSGIAGGGDDVVIDENITWPSTTSVSGSVQGSSLAIRQITDTQTFMVEDDVTKVEMSIGWSGGYDLDFTLYDSEGKSEMLRV